MPSEPFDIFTAQRRIFESSLRPLERLVGLAIVDFYSRKSPRPYPGVDLLARRTGLERKAVMRALAGIQETGAIRVTTGKRGTSNVYDLSPLMKLVPQTDQSLSGTSPLEGPVPPEDQSLSVTSTGTSEGLPLVPQRDRKDPSEGSHGRNPKRERAKRTLAHKAPPGFVFNDSDLRAEADASARGVDVEATRAKWLAFEYEKPKRDLHRAWRNFLAREQPPRRGRQRPVQQAPDDISTLGKTLGSRGEVVRLAAGGAK